MAPERNREVSDPDAFDAYFKKADLNQDGKISHEEALLFFEGSNLPRHTFDEIWVIADHKYKGFFGREEFYDALKLVSVAQQRERGETLDDYVADEEILCGPASANIPPPQIISLPPDHIPGWATTPIPPTSFDHPQPLYHSISPGPEVPRTLPSAISRSLVSPDYSAYVSPTYGSPPNPPPADGISAPSSFDHPQPFCNALLGCKAIHSHHTPPPHSVSPGPEVLRTPPSAISYSVVSPDYSAAASPTYSVASPPNL